MKSMSFKELDPKVCETKFKNFKRTCMTCTYHNNKSGNNPMRKCTYYDEMHELFHDDDTVTPAALCSNRKGSKKRVNREEYADSIVLVASDSTNEIESVSSDAEEDKMQKKKKKKKKKREKLQSQET